MCNFSSWNMYIQGTRCVSDGIIIICISLVYNTVYIYRHKTFFLILGNNNVIKFGRTLLKDISHSNRRSIRRCSEREFCIPFVSKIIFVSNYFQKKKNSGKFNFGIHFVLNSAAPLLR